MVITIQREGDSMADINELVEFKNTSFKTETKDDYVRIRMSKKQKKAFKMMAKSRKMNMTELVLELLQYEKETSVILNKVLEKDFK
jgi:predicted DNA binding CopG/RHH family protein